MCGIGLRTEIDCGGTHDVGQVLVLVGVAIVPDRKEDGVPVAAVAARWHLYAGVHAVGADGHLVGGQLAVGTGVHHFQVGPIVALARRSAGNLRRPPEMDAGGHEDFGVGDVERRSALEEKQIEAIEGVDAVWTGKFEAIPAVERHLGVGHHFHALLRRSSVGARGCMVEDDGTRSGVYDAHPKGDILPALGLKQGIGTDVSCREMEAIDQHGSFGVLPVDPSVSTLEADGCAAEFAVMACRPNGVSLLLPVGSMGGHGGNQSQTSPKDKS